MKVIIIIISVGYLPSREAKLKKSAKNYFIRDNKLKNDRIARNSGHLSLPSSADIFQKQDGGNDS